MKPQLKIHTAIKVLRNHVSLDVFAWVKTFIIVLHVGTNESFDDNWVLGSTMV